MASKNRFLALFLFATLTLPLQATASQDCREEAKEEVQSCDTVAKSAEQANSDVASGLAGGGANVNDGASDLSAISQWGRGNLQKASVQCKEHLQKCLNKCTQARSQAQDPNLKNAISKNAEYCNDQISNSLARLQSAEQQLASTEQASRQTAMSSGDSQYRDQNIDDKANSFNQEDVHQVASPGSYAPGDSFKGPNGEFCAVVGVGGAGCRVRIGAGPIVNMPWSRIPAK